MFEKFEHYREFLAFRNKYGIKYSSIKLKIGKLKVTEISIQKYTFSQGYFVLYLFFDNRKYRWNPKALLENIPEISLKLILQGYRSLVFEKIKLDNGELNITNKNNNRQFILKHI